MTASVVHQDLPHQLRRNRKEMGAILPLGKILIDQTNVSFVDQGGALQGVTRALVLQVMMSDTAQLCVNQGHQRVERFAVAASPAAQQLRDLTRRVPLLHPSHPPSRRGSALLVANQA